MFGDLMGKLQDMKQQMEDAKDKLKEMTATAEADNGRVKVIVTGDHKIKDITIADDLSGENNKEELQELLIVALNKAMEKADELHEQEMQGVAKFNIPGLDL